MEKAITLCCSKRIIRCVSVILCIVILSVTLISALYVASNAMHHCCEEDCPVCSYIDQCESILRGSDTGTAAPVLSALVILVSICAVHILNTSFSIPTPVALRVRIDY